MAKPVRVLIVDDSALMRQMLSAILGSDPRFDVVDTASDPLIAREKIKRHNPDVITLDVEMPRMNGLDFLEKIMKLRPTPVVMISSLTSEGSEATLKALEIGAVDVVGKPAGFIGDGMEELRQEIMTKILAAAESQVKPGKVLPWKGPSKPGTFLDRVIAIGASTGGVPAIGAILQALPSNAPPVVIVQHMPESFTGRLANRLDHICEVSVCEARNGQVLEPGHVYVAPGGRMMRLMPGRQLRLSDEVKVNGFRPSVDVLFNSVAECESARAVGVLLTGMGHDGAKGLLRLRQSGAVTFGQDQGSSVVYGMPRVAHLLGAVCHQLPLSRISDALLDICRAGTGVSISAVPGFA